MNTVSKSVLLISLVALAPFASQAKTLEQAYIDSAKAGPGVPVPIAVVAPVVNEDEVGQAVKVEFVVDTKGMPSGFSVKSSTDDALAEAVVAAVKQWRFTPAVRNGAPVATKVVLPVSVVDADTARNTLAVN